jgi:predicted XRE-type DNA-binding protein
MAKTAIKTNEEEVKIERTVGSVYHALGLPDADEMERKARLVSTINDTIASKGLTQVQAADLVGIDQPTLSKLLRGRFRSVSTDKLVDMLNALGRDVTIVVGAMSDNDRVRGRTLVAVS